MMKKIILGALAVMGLYFALFSGEYSTLDLLKQRKTRDRLLYVADSLQSQVDSLIRIDAMIRSDPGIQEKIAREEFGMVRGDNEILYKFIGPSFDDSSANHN